MKQLLKTVDTLLDLCFPRICFCCSDVMVDQESYLCTSCLLNAPYIRREFIETTESIFWGLFPIQHLAILWYYNKGSDYAHLIHRVKYENEKQLGFYLGKLLANKELEMLQNANIDYLVPVPIHSQKLSKRGYNQAEWIAKGIAHILNIPICTDVLIKESQTISQTEKSGYERLMNPQKSFSLASPEKLEDKHILLIDDVLTTGATLMACAEELIKIKGITLSLGAIFASK